MLLIIIYFLFNLYLSLQIRKRTLRTYARDLRF